MSGPWGSTDNAPVVSGGTVTLVEGTTFCICGRSGDIRPASAQGLFSRDTRVLSRFELTVDGQRLDPLAVHQPTPYSAVFIGRRPPQGRAADSTLLVVQRRYIGNGLREDVAVRNLGIETAAVALSLTVDADFAGLFDVKEGRARDRAGIVLEAGASAIRMSYQRGDESRGLHVVAQPPATVAKGQLTWTMAISPHEEISVSVHAMPVVDGVELPSRYRPGQAVEASQPATRLAEWRSSAPTVDTPDVRFRQLLSVSTEDLGMLRIFDPDHPDRVVVAAGAPWFMTLFGRDSLLASWMLLPFDSSIAYGTLRTLAELQGEKLDVISEEQPGRILHEVRSGFDSELGPGGRNVYYGSIDATPLFVMLLGELSRWTSDFALIEDLLPHADKALEWVEKFGDRDGDGFVEYQRETDRGLLNQGWKDSGDAIAFTDGVRATPPIALAEVQGYVYAAYLARARLADRCGDIERARYCREQATRLKRLFNQAFWLPDRGTFALALDRDKRLVDAVASNAGHCLWTGIVDDDKARSVAASLMSPEMFSGFGVRTLATSMGAYNPASYHNGSVWPHDNAIIAAGMMRYGFVQEAQRIAVALIDAAGHFEGRLPELFCGFDRDEFPIPVPYPTSCMPQAWAAAAPVYLLRTLLRFEPVLDDKAVFCSPALPERLRPLRIDRLHLDDAKIRIEIDDDSVRIVGLPDGVRLTMATVDEWATL
jgi:glycogen debranching enzyme